MKEYAMNLLSITHPEQGHKAWGYCGIELNRRDALVLVWHLLASLLGGHRWVRFDWAKSGVPGGWYRIAQPLHEMRRGEAYD